MRYTTSFCYLLPPSSSVKIVAFAGTASILCYSAASSLRILISASSSVFERKPRPTTTTTTSRKTLTTPYSPTGS
jgi:hypothetical protein